MAQLVTDSVSAAHVHSLLVQLMGWVLLHWRFLPSNVTVRAPSTCVLSS